MNFKTLFYAFLSLTLFLNCSSGGDDPGNSNNNPDPNPNAITYDANIKGIITNNCTSCHGSTPSNGATFSLTTYNSVKSRVDNIISRVNSSSNPMPPAPNSPLSSSQKSLIQQWKDDGLLEN